MGDYTVVRPLLTASREEIEAYLAARHERYVTDVTNESDAYTRNYIRLHVLPALETLNPSLYETSACTQRRLRQDATSSRAPWTTPMRRTSRTLRATRMRFPRCIPRWRAGLSRAFTGSLRRTARSLARSIRVRARAGPFDQPLRVRGTARGRYGAAGVRAALF